MQNQPHFEGQKRKKEICPRNNPTKAKPKDGEWWHSQHSTTETLDGCPSSTLDFHKKGLTGALGAIGSSLGKKVLLTQAFRGFQLGFAHDKGLSS
ncbi:hypothetical protein DSO57_1007774 [Entomophthora muscae]|uniref:Uncharacterized protein n=1 Tax=Entomophthora muscae TaxID=34485 RepID=A0ACC2UTG1_9FUNG|nr:hypothetical protein DSO57_1007774 [Entomophthora muscae]